MRKKQGSDRNYLWNSSVDNKWRSLHVSLRNNNYLMLLLILGLSSAGPGVNSNNNNNNNDNNNYYSTSVTQYSNSDNDNRRGASYSNNNHFQGNQFPRRISASTYENNNNNNNNKNNSNNYYYLHVLNLNLTFLQDFELGCSQYCAEQSQHHYNAVCINQGCKQWKTGLREGCSSVCRGSEGNFREHYGCQVGCTKAIEDYYFRITGLLGAVDPPTLVSGSLNSTSLQLSWEGSYPELPYLVFTIQRRLYRRNHQWETISTQPLNQTWFTVQGLTPYTEYQFRIGWILAQDFPPFYSQESNPIGTLPEGLPNPPEITSIQPISNTSVSVTWIPPSRPNGPLVAYILTLQKLPDGRPIIKEIPMAHNPRGFTFSGLSPNTNYSLSISAQNRAGRGNATNTFFVTPQSSISNDMSKRPEPRLLLQGASNVYLQPIDLLLGPDVTVYSSATSGQAISAIATHIKYKWVFIATADGQVVRRSLENNETTIIFPRGRLDIVVSFMSVDWLHNKLFLVGQMRQSRHWVIKRSELGGDGLVTVYPFLGSEPVDFHADPFTGYIYWVSPSSARRNVSGLYKMDMLSDPSDPIPEYVTQPQTVLESENGELGPFTVDFTTYRILIVHKGKNTVLQVSLNGDWTDIRQNTQRPQFQDALAIGMYNGLLYYTTGKDIIIEEYSSQDNTFYQNSFGVPKSHQPCNRLIIIHPDLQPVPVPMAPPQMPQVVMGTRQALVSWRPPAVIAGLGKDAWTSWKYQVIVSDNTSIPNIEGTQYLLKNLQPSATYTIQILAYSSSGRGPLSTPVKGTTLRETSYNISLLWASASGIYSTDVLGDNVHRLVPSEQWAAGGSGRYTPYISSIAWQEAGSFYFALSNGSVFYYNAEGAVPRVTPVVGISYAQSVAYDYIGQKLYWSNPTQQMILRCSHGSCDNSSDKVEWLHLITMAKEIAIDSLQGMLIWNTGHSLEASRLNSYSHTVLYQTGLFSGVQIVGFTVDDSDLRQAYFVTRSSSGSILRRLRYDKRGSQRAVEITRFNDVNLLGPIRYFNNRILCLEGSSQSLFFDVTSNTRATLTLDSISNVSSIYVRDEYSRRLSTRAERNNIQVIPNSVPAWTIKIQGKWDNFTISWQNVTNVNMGKLYYEVIVNNTVSRVTSNPSIVVSNGIFPPFSEIDITIIAVSYWASSEATVVRRQTPSGKPSEPRNVRAFVEKLSPVYLKARELMKKGVHAINSVTTAPGEAAVMVELRWDPPEYPNGKVLGYVIHCWKDGVKKSNCMCDVDTEQLSCRAENLPPNSTFSFAVEAYTEQGTGNRSRTVQANLQYDYPVEKMLLTKADKLEIFDVDRNSAQPLSLGALNPVSSVYAALEDSIYWINDGQDLMKYSLQHGNKTRVLSLSGDGQASHLTFDWIGQRLFWASENHEKDQKFAVKAFDLTAIESAKNVTPTTIILTSSPIRGLTVDPFTSVLLWTTSDRNGIITINSSRTDGSSAKPFLSKDRINCNCSNCSMLGEPVTFDSSGFGTMRRGFLMTNDKSIYLTDEGGCDCLPLINMTANGFSWSRTPPYKLAGNQRHIFWSAGYIYASAKPGNGVTELMPAGVREISLLGPSSQPYPDLKCLIPSRLDPHVRLIDNHSSFSLTLQLPFVEMVDCEYKDISMAALKYTVFYGTVNRISECTNTSLSHCMNVTTSQNVLTISDLAPYTWYAFFVLVTNVYREMQGLEPLASNATMFRTAPGAPMPPKLLHVEPLTPHSARVIWRRPDKLNGAKVWYQINWDPVKERISPGPGWSDVEAKAGAEWYDSTNNESATEFHWVVKSLHPGCSYDIWVSAYSEKGDALSSSEKHTIKTYPNPSNVTLISATPHVLNLKWEPPADGSIIRHQIHFRVGWETTWNWTEPTETAKLSPPFNFTISQLKPKTVYGFKVKAWYIGDPEDPYYWPKDQSQFMIETLADTPGAPGQPIARNIGRDLYEVTWERADDNGATVEIYSLECRMDVEIILRDEDGKEKVLELDRVKRQSGNEVIAQKLVASEKQDIAPVKYARWVQVYNGSDRRWQIENLDRTTPYAFRVRAKNAYGWGEFSKVASIESLALLAPGIAEPQPLGIILGTVGSSLVILAVFGSLLLFVYKKKVKEEPTLQSPSSSERQVELATLRELPGGSSFIHQSNILYAASDLILDLELAGVAQIGRNQISLTKFLGSGAFGEVYEGSVVNLQNSEETRVAIKTLRKGASANEKLEFIQEAKLMTQFRHPHILQLLGICIDTDPCCLLLELMDGGDLLSYLRSNRPHLGSSVVLRMPDLLKMCVDVAKGCVYLEEMHFVHRDLAARNCLVRLVNSVEGSNDANASERVVKIGDFGLARDVYRNDYYRKEGEGLLPVRWMAPESLIDGVYTTQSDVWAFGVLLWEIMTLGQQPYPARNNLEVLYYVRNGGRLQQPPRCPPRLSQLMLRCWEFNADNRPTFKDCLAEVELILREYEFSLEEGGHMSSLESTILQLQQYNNYLQPTSESKSNYYGDAATIYPPVINSAYAGSAAQHNNVVYADTGAAGSCFPKYLEIVSDSSITSEQTQPTSLPFSTTDEGYEIPLPRKPPRNPQIHRQNFQNIPADLGLPSPSYWNTMPEAQPIFQQLEASSRPTDGNNMAQPSSPQYDEAQGLVKSQDKYVSRIPTSKDGLEQKMDSREHFRNLLASTTSEDADMDGDLYYSEGEFGSPRGPGNVFTSDFENYSRHPQSLHNGVVITRQRKARFPVSLSDSSHGSGDTSTCTDDAEGARSSESNENELPLTENPEYLSMICQSGTLSRLKNINNNNNRYDHGCLEERRNGDYLSNGYIYDDGALDAGFTPGGSNYATARPPPISYQYSQSISEDDVRGDYLHADASYRNRATLKMGKTNSG